MTEAKQNPENILHLATAYRIMNNENFLVENNNEFEKDSKNIPKQRNKFKTPDGSLHTADQENDLKGTTLDGQIKLHETQFGKEKSEVMPEEDLEMWNKAFERLRPPNYSKKKTFQMVGKSMSKPCEELLQVIDEFNKFHELENEWQKSANERIFSFVKENAAEREEEFQELIHQPMESAETPIPRNLIRF